MKKIVLAVAVLLLSVAVTARAQDGDSKQDKNDKNVKVTADKLLGVWKPIHVDLPDGNSVNIEFSKGGQMKVYGQTQVKGKDGKVKVKKYKHQATYKIAEKGFTLTSKDAKGKVTTQTITIIRLTDTEMATRNDKGVEGVYQKQK
jgi:uncharacterized protein (TIGR03066 family)